MYKVKELDYYESLQLFSWHAFGQDHPMKGYINHSKRILNHCQGIPLALQVLGSSLSGGSLDLWENALGKLEEISDPQILKVIELSYEFLQDDHDKNLFLDIACFFVGKDKDYAIKILDECNFYTMAGIQNLIDRCLLTIAKGKKLMMHQLLQEMIWEIVCRESPMEAGKRSRPLHYKHAFNVLRGENGTESVEGLILDMDVLKEGKPAEIVSAKRHYTDYFSNKLRRSLRGSSSKRLCLGFLSWLPVNPNSAESFAPSNEVVFRTNAFSRMQKLKLLRFNTVCLAGSYEQFPKKLRWLHWSGFPLSSIPDDLPLGSLVVIEMRYSNLHHLWERTKFIRSLKIIDLSHSYNLTMTPDVSGLPNLERLILKKCTSLMRVHESIGSLERLSHLNLRGCKRLRKLPREICQLKSLQNLILSGCSKLQLPVELSKTMYHADGTLRDQLHSVTEGLKIMDLLSIKSLYSLFWSWLSPRRSPESATSSYSLKILDLSDCSLAENAISIDLSVLSSLQHLDLSKNPMCSLPESIKGLSVLQTLVIVECTRLQSLPELPLSLKTLDARSCRSLERISNLPNLLRSLSLKLGDCGKLVEVHGLFKLVPIQNVDEVVNISGLVGLESMGGIEVELWNHLTHTKKKCPVQGLHELGIFSTFLPGSMVPACFNNETAGSPISISVPSPPNLRVRGLTVCILYMQHDEEYRFGGNYIRIKNKTKGVKWIYSPVFFGIPGAKKTMLWLIQLKFGNKLERGDQVIVSLNMRYEVKVLGINFAYDEQEAEATQSNSEAVVKKHHPYFPTIENVIDEDMSGYEPSPGVYLLCHHF